MNFQLPGRDVPPPQFGGNPQPAPQTDQNGQPLTPDQQNAVNGNGLMPDQPPQQYGQPPQPAPDPNVKQANVGYAPPPGMGNGGFLTDAQSALSGAMRTNPGAGYLQRGLGGAPAPSPQLQGVAQQVRPPPMMRAQPQPNRVAGYPAYRTR